MNTTAPGHAAPLSGALGPIVQVKAGELDIGLADLGPADGPVVPAMNDLQAVRGYERLLRNATAADLPTAHAEGYGRLTPAQRDLLFDRLLARIRQHEQSAPNDLNARRPSFARRSGRLVLRGLQFLALADPAKPQAPGFRSYAIGGYRLIWFDPDVAGQLPENAAWSDA